MTKLSLSALPYSAPVKIRFELPAAVCRDLVAHTDILAPTSGYATSCDPGERIAPMLRRFMTADQGFGKARGSRSD